MDRLSHQMGQETPKWPNKKLPVCLCTCSPLRAFLASYSPQVKPDRKEALPPEGGHHQAALSWEDAVCLHEAPCLGRAIGLIKAPTGNSRTGAQLWPPHPTPQD